jgi:hypothetical protein
MAKRAKRPPSQRSACAIVRAPYDGWNARDAISAMKPTEAWKIINFIPGDQGLKTRPGYEVYSTGVGVRVDTLMEYRSPTANKLFAASSGGTIYECVSTSTATNAVAGFTNGKFQHTMMTTPGGSYLWVCNGAAPTFMYDGSSWATASVTGCTAGSSAFANVTIHGERIWLVQKNTLDAWYLPVQSVQGAATRLPLGAFCKRGGYLEAIATWTRDGGTGMDDQIAFITSEGEALLYSGIDPASAGGFSKVGTFHIPKPVGRRCVTQVGADLALITEHGVVPFSSILPLSPSGSGKVAATDRIVYAFETAYRQNPTAFGWQVFESERESLLFVNVPIIENTEIEQFCMSAHTGAWTRFTGINAQCWTTFGGKLYFGGTDGTVYRYGDAQDDNGEPIFAEVAGAFSDGGDPRLKQFLMARPFMIVPDGTTPGIGIHVDYNTDNIDVSGITYDTGGTQWDTAQWDSFQWAGGTVVTRDWQTVNGIGTAVSIEVKVQTQSQLKYNTAEIMYELGGYL